MTQTLFNLFRPTKAGLYCPEGDFYIDPSRQVPRAIITHGHSDHARKGHKSVLATRPTLDFMAMRYGPNFAGSSQAIEEGEILKMGSVEVTLLPAGHMLGSVQVLVEGSGPSIIVSGDFKRSADPTCPPFDVHRCKIFVTEATFALPLYNFPSPSEEMDRLKTSLEIFSDRPHLICAYSIGKAQRVIALLREEGFNDPIYVHKAIANATPIYKAAGCNLGSLKILPDEFSDVHEFSGKVILSPPGGGTQALKAPITSFASGWMRIKSAARSRGGDLPLILSDHADWGELVGTIKDVGCETVWITHGREDVLAGHIEETLGVQALALKDLNQDKDLLEKAQ
jgi:putative mRNA 3-end processing factor